MLRNKVRKISNKLGTHFKLEHDGVKCQTLHWLALELGTDDGDMQEHTICHNHSAHRSNNIIRSPILTNNIVPQKNNKVKNKQEDTLPQRAKLDSVLQPEPTPVHSCVLLSSVASSSLMPSAL